MPTPPQRANAEQLTAYVAKWVTDMWQMRGPCRAEKTCNPLKKMEPMSGLGPPYGLRITNEKEEYEEID